MPRHQQSVKLTFRRYHGAAEGECKDSTHSPSSLEMIIVNPYDHFYRNDYRSNNYSQNDVCLITSLPLGHSYDDKLIGFLYNKAELHLLPLAVSWGWWPFKNSFSVDCSPVRPTSIGPTGCQIQAM